VAARQAAVRKPKFDIVTALRRVRAAIKPFQKAALFELAEMGHDSSLE
jgi:endonuclease-3